jgi:hypothetical protein
MILILLIVLNSSTPKECFSNIKDGNIKTAYTQFLSLKNTKNDYYTLSKAYFSRHTVTAIYSYQQIFEHSNSSELKLFSKKKLYEYYYAIGLYKRAEVYKEDYKTASNHNSKINYPYFVIQMGVFSAESNALALKQKIRKIIRQGIKLKKELRDGMNVIVVNVGPFRSKDSALKQLNNLRDQLGLSGWIKEIN